MRKISFDLKYSFLSQASTALAITSIKSQDDVTGDRRQDEVTEEQRTQPSSGWINQKAAVTVSGFGFNQPSPDTTKHHQNKRKMTLGL